MANSTTFTEEEKIINRYVSFVVDAVDIINLVYAADTALSETHFHPHVPLLIQIQLIFGLKKIISIHR